MIEVYKKRGETPLEALHRVRVEQPELAHARLSYAGRLDPMAEGVLVVLVDNENNEREKFLGKSKIYQAEFLIGVSTDTHDVLGRINCEMFAEIEETKVIHCIRSFTEMKEQTYPWYSSKTVEGVPLFEYARAGNFAIKRPTRPVEIYDIQDIQCITAESRQIIDGIRSDIDLVQGDFRQKEISECWEKARVRFPSVVQLVSFQIHVSTGTYIRGLCETFEACTGVPAVLHKLVRTKVL